MTCRRCSKELGEIYWALHCKGFLPIYAHGECLTSEEKKPYRGRPLTRYTRDTDHRNDSGVVVEVS